LKRYQIGAVVIIAALVGAGVAWVLKPVGVEKEHVVFSLDWIPFGRHAGYYVALYNGFYDEEGLSVDIRRGFGSYDSLMKVDAGAADFGFGDYGSLVKARAEGAKVVAIGVIYGTAAHTVFTVEDRGITEPKDLEGKTIGGPVWDANRIVFPAFCAANDVDIDKVNIVTLDPAAKIPSMLEGTIDATWEYIMHTPTVEKMAAERGLKVIKFNYGDYGVHIYSNGLVAREDTIRNKPGLVRRFVRATMRGLQWAFDHPENAADIIRVYHPTLEKDIIVQEIAIVKELAYTPEAMANTLGWMTREKIKSTIDNMVVLMDIDPAKAPTPEEMYTNEFLR
jgi:NitT/TauT family transport system substrate-binding protein